METRPVIPHVSIALRCWPAITFGVGLGLLALGQSACGGSTCPTCPGQSVCPQPTPTPAPTPDLTGYWTNRDDSSHRAQFTVTSERSVHVVRNLWVTLMDSPYRWQHQCRQDFANGYTQEALAVANGRLTTTFPDSEGWFSINVEITFESADSGRVRGTFTDTRNDPDNPCYGRVVTVDVPIARHPYL